MIIERANVCDDCKVKLVERKCELCGKEMCRSCCNGTCVSVKGIKVFDYWICRKCNDSLYGKKLNIELKPETMKQMKDEITEQLKRGLIVANLGGQIENENNN